jgi:hypothetical protein
LIQLAILFKLAMVSTRRSKRQSGGAPEPGQIAAARKRTPKPNRNNLSGFAATAPIPRPPRKKKAKTRAQLAAARLLATAATPPPPSLAASRPPSAKPPPPTNTPPNEPPQEIINISSAIPPNYTPNLNSATPIRGRVKQSDSAANTPSGKSKGSIKVKAEKPGFDPTREIYGHVQVVFFDIEWHVNSISRGHITHSFDINDMMSIGGQWREMVALLDKEIKEFSENRSRYGIDAPTLYEGIATTGSRIAGAGGRATVIRDDLAWKRVLVDLRVRDHIKEKKWAFVCFLVVHFRCYDYNPTPPPKGS